MEKSPIKASAENLELENLKLKVYNLEGKLEIQKLKHQKVLRALEAENAQALANLKTENALALRALEAKNAQALTRLNAENAETLTILKAKSAQALQTLEAENAKLREEEKTKENKDELKKSNEKRKADEKNEFQELSETEKKILEGLEKYVICKRRSFSNYFSCRDKWFQWMMNNMKQEFTVDFINCKIIIKDLKSIDSIHFTEDKDFPINNIKNEMILPIIDQGWSAKNTKCYFLRSDFRPEKIKPSSKEDLNQPGYGKYFTFNLSFGMSEFSYRLFKTEHSILDDKFHVLVFVKTTTTKSDCLNYDTHIDIIKLYILFLNLLVLN